ncbi:hypothetical protein [Rhizobium halophytocola]|uniref:Uncharacterized protein n=1 Tax=Rhizobium halophytocola TaxID=735519 RepID=A0ABS4E617_9HYPH|nr:hypothetical protein [Rhizobium halophytocola]MBP1853358.1 hypothetical protein [Rhizobium halophytocola]
MVDPISRISASDPSRATDMSNSLSIGSEPDNAWVAARQARINADLAALAAINNGGAAPSKDEPADGAAVDEDASGQGRQTFEAQQPAPAGEAPPEEPVLSGESERIGSVNFDDDTPFGHRSAIL